MKQIKIVPEKPEYYRGKEILYVVCKPSQDDLQKTYESRVRKKPIINMFTGKIYPSISHASKDTGLNKGGISKVVNGKQASVGGMTFKYI